jgi:hypothetical protein
MTLEEVTERLGVEQVARWEADTKLEALWTSIAWV